MALPDSAVLDTSVLLRLVHDHRDEDQARVDLIAAAWMDRRIELTQLDLAVYEFVNVVTRRWRRDAETAQGDVRALFRLRIPIVSVDRDLAGDAARIAAGSGLSGYDAAFLGAARRLRIPLVTADRRLASVGGDDVLPLGSIAA